MKRIGAMVLVTVLGYSIIVFAYMHSRFTPKDYIARIEQQLHEIEMKIDKLLEMKGAIEYALGVNRKRN